jgi:tetratricopeptide (TPR) repeat protein
MICLDAGCAEPAHSQYSYGELWKQNICRELPELPCARLGGNSPLNLRVGRQLVRSWFHNLAALLALGFVCLLNLGAQTSERAANDPERREAMRLYDQHKMTEAAALLERVATRYPNDSVVHEALGTALLSRGETQTDPTKRKADRLHARAELLRAKELGDNSDLCRVLLAGIPEDGSDRPVSKDQQVQAAMDRGEASFAQGNFEQAIEEYSRALEMDPKLYLAAVYVGDMYFRLKQVANAGKWFARAAQIDPDQEIAYRYWGDALLQAGRVGEARSKFFEGLAANPYSPASWGGLNGWIKATHLDYKNVKINLPPAPTVDAKGGTVITVDPSALGKEDNSGAAWLSYSMERSLWRSTKFPKEFPQEKEYRHSLKEEAGALSLAAAVFEELQPKEKSKNPDPSLRLLSQLKADGLIEAYVLLILPDEGIQTDFPAYRAEHRDKLIQFLDNYLVPPAP